MLKRKIVNDVNDVNDVNVWCPGEVAFMKQRLILRRYLAGEEDDRCAICLDALVPKLALYLPCKHAFHYKCWQHLVEQRTYTCPLCRANFSETLSAVGVTIVNVPAVAIVNLPVLTIFTQMDLYDFMLELLWRNYEREADTILEADDIFDADDIFQ
jgi:hypothetical protein